MRIKEFLFRTCIFVPITIFAILLFFMIFGMVTDSIGIGASIRTSLYSRVFLAILSLSTAVVIICQANACWRDKKEIRAVK